MPLPTVLEPGPWYSQWIVLLPVGSIVLGGALGLIASRVLGRFLRSVGHIVWYMTTVVIAALLEIPLVYYFAVGIAGIVYISFVVYEDWKDLRRGKEEASRTRGERRRQHKLGRRPAARGDGLDWLKPRQKPNRNRLVMMMESGHLVDEVADVVQTQVIAHQARASIRNREEVPLYVQTEEDRPPVWMENLLVETGLAEPPGTDSRYVSEDSKNLWKGIKTGAVTLDAESKVRTSLHQAGLLAASILVVLACAWVSGQNIAAKADAAARTAAVVEETVDQGFAEELPAFSTQTLVPGPRPWHGGLFTLSARLVDGAGAGRCRIQGPCPIRSCRSTGGAAGVRSTAGAGFHRRPRAPSHPVTNSALHPATTLQTLAGARERRWMRPGRPGEV